MIRPGIKDNTVCKTKLENYRLVMRFALLLKEFEYMLLPLLTINLKLYDQQLGYRNQSSCNLFIYINNYEKKYYAI